jgi:hypothetical protein
MFHTKQRAAINHAASVIALCLSFAVVAVLGGMVR